MFRSLFPHLRSPQSRIRLDQSHLTSFWCNKTLASRSLSSAGAATTHHHIDDDDEDETTIRQDLAVAHRLTANLGYDMLTWNHISHRFRDGCLITPGNMLWTEIKPQDMVYSSSNITADIIHSTLYNADPAIKSILHWHSPAATAVACLEDGFMPLTQDAAYFYDKVCYYDWDGVTDDASEGPAMTAAVQNNPGCNTLVMNNHGFVTFGRSVKEVWVLAYYFERACEIQLRCMASGGKIRMPNPKVMQKAAKTSYSVQFAPGASEWEALCRSVQFD